MKKQPEITLHLQEDLLRRLLYLSEAEHRTPNNQMLLLIRNSVAYFERTKGKMDPKALAAIDISPYMPENEADFAQKDEKQ